MSVKPVSPSVYQAVFDLNVALEKVSHDLQELKKIHFLPGEQLTFWYNLISRMRTEANHQLLFILSQRESRNAAHYDHLCYQWERTLRDPADVLLEAERLKKQTAGKRKGTGTGKSKRRT
ncbi:MAG TPA: hypothetical protein VKY85_25270 [Candidatus Angelobacter sp.]|nr:hypothetical protein [Candidatus Angelobacter sp.]